MTIGERIALALERADKSQRDLAKFMRLSSPTVSAMLSKKDGEIDSIKYLKAVEELTGYKFEWLRTGEGPEKEMLIAKLPDEKTIQKLEDLVASKQKTIDLLEEKIRRMEEDLKKQNVK